MPKALSITGLVVAIVMVLVFGLNLAIGVPFGKDSAALGMVPQIGLLLAALVLAYMSWTTFREQP